MTASTEAAAAGEPVDLQCQDGTPLRGHFFAAPGTATPVLISPATGIKQQFYFRFAAWLAAQGYDVLVFDYRGIGLSLRGRLQDCQATLTEWGQQDQVAAIEWLAARTGHAQVSLIGHSAGGQMIGLLTNHARVRRLVGVAASTGWFRRMRPGYRLKARTVMRALLPLGTRLKGYAPTAIFGLGENLPAKVGRQWGQWCAAGGYATNAVRHQPAMDFHAHVRTPVTVLYATDDDIANQATVDDFIRTLPAAPKRVLRIHPNDHGLKAIGHMDWFRNSHRALWPVLAAALA